MTQRKQLRMHRILLASIALAAAVAAGFVLLSRTTPVPEDPRDTPWIPLPRSGMDASQMHLRHALNLVANNGSVFLHPESLFFNCDDDAPRGRIEARYIAHVADEDGSGWRTIFDVRGQDIDLRWSMDGATVPPPPEPPPNGSTPHRNDNAILVTPFKETTRTRMELDAVRRAWDTDALWHSPQGDLMCHDGYPVLLEACVAGRYAVRLRNCSGDTYSAGRDLLQALKALLPAAEPPYWQRTDGSRVTSP